MLWSSFRSMIATYFYIVTPAGRTIDNDTVVSIGQYPYLFDVHQAHPWQIGFILADSNAIIIVATAAVVSSWLVKYSLAGENAAQFLVSVALGFDANERNRTTSRNRGLVAAERGDGATV